MAIVVEGGELSALEWQAVKVAGKEADQLRGELEAGTAQEVDFTLHVVGTIDVSEAKLQLSSTKPSEESLALAKVIVDSLSTQKQTTVNGAVKGALTLTRL